MKPEHKKILIIVIVSIVVVLALVLGLVFGLRKDDDEKKNPIMKEK